MTKEEALKKLNSLKHDMPSSWFMEAISKVRDACTDELERSKYDAVFWAFYLTMQMRASEDRAIDKVEKGGLVSALNMLGLKLDCMTRLQKDFQVDCE